MKESVAIHLALQPIAAYAYNAVSACKILIKTHETSREQAEFGILLTALGNLLTRTPAFSNPEIPPMYHDIIRKARLEADALLALLEEDSKTYCECNDDLNGIENNKPFVFTFLGASFVSNQRTIFLLSEIDPRSHEFWGPWWKYKFHVHGTSELTSDHYELAKLSYSVAVREDGTADQLQGVAKVMLDEWDGRFDERKQYIIGLSSMEQELLSLNPMAKYVNPWEPEFNMALAFD